MENQSSKNHLLMKSNWLYQKFPEMEIEDEHELYNEVLERVILNPRFYLNNLDNLWVFKCRFIKYRKGL